MEHVLSMKEQNSSPHQLIQKKPCQQRKECCRVQLPFNKSLWISAFFKCIIFQNQISMCHLRKAVKIILTLVMKYHAWLLLTCSENTGNRILKEKIKKSGESIKRKTVYSR